MRGERYQFSRENEGNQPRTSEDFPGRELITEKIIISRAIATERLGSANVHLSAENLYTSLYEPEKAEGLADSNPKYPDRLDILGAPLRSQPKKIPSREEFVAVVKHALTREIDFGQCFSNVAREQFRNVVGKSESTVLWTDGDDSGVPEHGLPGSHEQIRKIAYAQFFNRIRREVAQDRGRVNPHDVLSVIAMEGKIKFIPDLIENFKRKGIETVVIVEDRQKNLVSAADTIHRTSDIETFLVLIKNDGRPGGDSKNVDTAIPDTIHVMEDISGLSLLLEMNGVFSEGKKVGAIFDMDGVLSDDDIRKRLQTKAVIDALRRNDWI